MEPGENADSLSQLDPRETALLGDIVRYPDSGIAERYKRLGLSVRQGQKLKRALLEHGIIREQVETTHRGKIRVVRLTETGQHLADRISSPDEPETIDGSETIPDDVPTTE